MPASNFFVCFSGTLFLTIMAGSGLGFTKEGLQF